MVSLVVTFGHIARADSTDQTLQKADGESFTGHQTSKTEFVTCYKSTIEISAGDKILRVGSCQEAQNLRIVLEFATNMYGQERGLAPLRIGSPNVAGKYALVNWKSTGRFGQALLTGEGRNWRVLTAVPRRIDTADAVAHGVPSETFIILQKEIQTQASTWQI